MPTNAAQLVAPPGAYEFALGPCQFAKETADGKTPVSVYARSPGVVDHWYWGRIVHDFAGMRHRNVIPLDYLHDQGEPVGYVDDFDTQAGLRASGALVSAFPADRAEEIATKGKAGVPYQASIDWAGPARFEELEAGLSVEVNGQTVDGPALVVRDWTLNGIAVCLYGVDRSTHTDFSRRHPFAANTQPKEQRPMTLDPTTTPPPADPPAGDTQPNAVDEAREQLGRFLDHFGPDGARMFADGLTFADAMQHHAEKLAERVDQLTQQLADLQQAHDTKTAEHTGVVAQLAERDRQLADVTAERDRLAQARDPGADPVTFTPADAPGGAPRTGDPPQKRQSKPSGLDRFAAGMRLPGRPAAADSGADPPIG